MNETPDGLPRNPIRTTAFGPPCLTLFWSASTQE